MSLGSRSDDALVDWLAAGPIVAPRSIITTVAASIPTLDQRRQGRWHRRSTMRPTLHLRIALVILVVGGVITGTLYVASAPTVVPAPSSAPEPMVDPGVFRSTGTPLFGGDSRSATLLADGRVLIIGGDPDRNDESDRAELYDPDDGTFAETGDLIHPRVGLMATRLADGRVLIAGGSGHPAPDALDSAGGAGFRIAELYDPTTGTFGETGSLMTPRTFGTATLLDDGRVLVAGGVTDDGVTATAELYDPDTGTFGATGPMLDPRASHAAIRLLDGRVLVAGGFVEGAEVASTEVYDPKAGSWSRSGPMTTSRMAYGGPTQAALLPDGRVLFAGGLVTIDEATPPVARTEIDLYDPTTDSFEPGPPMDTGRDGPSITTLSDGRVLIAGGLTRTGAEQVECCRQLPALRTAEIYDPSTDHVIDTGPMRKARAGQTAVLLDDGDVLILGGQDGSGGGSPKRAERFRP